MKAMGTHLRTNAVGYVALFLALGIGTAWAVERDSIKSKHIVNEQVKPVDLNENAHAQWALVSSAGQIIRQSGGISVDGENEGAYVIDFGRSLGRRGLMATVSYEDASDTATAHVSPCGDNSELLRASCDYLASGADSSGRHAYVFTQVTAGSGGDAAAFWVATLPR